MSDESIDKEFEDMLRQFLRNKKYHDADELYKVLIVREKEFINLLDTEQKEEHKKLRAMFDRYEFLIQQDSFSNGFFEGVKA